MTSAAVIPAYSRARRTPVEASANAGSFVARRDDHGKIGGFHCSLPPPGGRTDTSAARIASMRRDRRFRPAGECARAVPPRPAVSPVRDRVTGHPARLRGSRAATSAALRNHADSPGPDPVAAGDCCSSSTRPPGEGPDRPGRGCRRTPRSSPRIRRRHNRSRRFRLRPPRLRRNPSPRGRTWRPGRARVPGARAWLPRARDREGHAWTGAARAAAPPAGRFRAPTSARRAVGGARGRRPRWRARAAPGLRPSRPTKTTVVTGSFATGAWNAGPHPSGTHRDPPQAVSRARLAARQLRYRDHRDIAVRPSSSAVPAGPPDDRDRPGEGPGAPDLPRDLVDQGHHGHVPAQSEGTGTAPRFSPKSRLTMHWPASHAASSAWPAWYTPIGRPAGRRDSPATPRPAFRRRRPRRP